MSAFCLKGNVHLFKDIKVFFPNFGIRTKTKLIMILLKDSMRFMIIYVHLLGDYNYTFYHKSRICVFLGFFNIKFHLGFYIFFYLISNCTLSVSIGESNKHGKYTSHRNCRCNVTLTFKDGHTRFTTAPPLFISLFIVKQQLNMVKFQREDYGYLEETKILTRESDIPLNKWLVVHEL